MTILVRRVRIGAIRMELRRSLVRNLYGFGIIAAAGASVGEGEQITTSAEDVPSQREFILREKRLQLL